jgi:hypothetical protein
MSGGVAIGIIKNLLGGCRIFDKNAYEFIVFLFFEVE